MKQRVPKFDVIGKVPLSPPVHTPTFFGRHSSYQEAEHFVMHCLEDVYAPLEIKIEKVWVMEEVSECPPHSWDRSGERCEKCGCKDWMT